MDIINQLDVESPAGIHSTAMVVHSNAIVELSFVTIYTDVNLEVTDYYETNANLWWSFCFKVALGVSPQFFSI